MRSCIERMERLQQNSVRLVREHKLGQLETEAPVRRHAWRCAAERQVELAAERDGGEPRLRGVVKRLAVEPALPNPHHIGVGTAPTSQFNHHQPTLPATSCRPAPGCPATSTGTRRAGGPRTQSQAQTCDPA